jgi:putative membrane protein
MASEPGAASGDFIPEQKLHPVSWLFVAMNHLRSLILPLLVALVTGLTHDFVLWISAAMFVPLIVTALWQQWVYRYGFSAHGLVIREGLIFRNVRTIDFGRIENVDTTRGVLHRLLGVVEVRVETSTGGSAEARIRVLDLAAVEAMRERIFARPAAVGASADAAEEVPAVEAEETLLSLPPLELVRYGLIDNRGMLVVAGIVGLLSQVGFFENMVEWSNPLLDWLPWENLAGLGLVVRLLLGTAFVGALILGTRVLSILLALVMLHGFRLTRGADDLHTRHGLLTRVTTTLRRRRIQAVHQTATLLHRLFGRVSLKVDLAGGLTTHGEGAQEGAQRHFRDLWLAPLVPPRDAERLILAALPQIRLHDLVWRSLSPRARWRIFRVLAVVWLLLASVPAVWWTGWWALPLLVAPLPLFWLHALLYVKYTGWALHEDFFALRRGWLTRRLALTPRDRMQSVHLRESPFDRRNGMAQLHIDIAGVSEASHHFKISYLDRSDAGRLAAELV